MQGAGALGFSTFLRALLHPNQLSIFYLLITIQGGSTSDKSDREFRVLLSGIKFYRFFAHPRSGQSNMCKTCSCSCGAIWHNCRIRCCIGSRILLRFCGMAFAKWTHVVAVLLFANHCKPIVFEPLCLADYSIKTKSDGWHGIAVRWGAVCSRMSSCWGFSQDVVNDHASDLRCFHGAFCRVAFLFALRHQESPQWIRDFVSSSKWI